MVCYLPAVFQRLTTYQRSEFVRTAGYAVQYKLKPTHGGLGPQHNRDIRHERLLPVNHVVCGFRFNLVEHLAELCTQVGLAHQLVDQRYRQKRLDDNHAHKHVGGRLGRMLQFAASTLSTHSLSPLTATANAS